MSSKYIKNLYEMTPAGEMGQGTRFASKHRPISPDVGAARLGYNLTELDPGKTAFPYHYHHINEELFLVIEGTGKVRMPDGVHAIKAGDLIACPPGPDAAHQITNDGSVPLKYLALSKMHDPEVVEYPDSGKYGVTVGRKAGRPAQESAFRILAFKKDGVDYWAGEDTELK
jgi:uncharacterized cupin superfamily protein